MKAAGLTELGHSRHPSSVFKSADIFLFLTSCRFEITLHKQLPSLRQPICSNFKGHVSIGTSR